MLCVGPRFDQEVSKFSVARCAPVAGEPGEFYYMHLVSRTVGRACRQKQAGTWQVASDVSLAQASYWPEVTSVLGRSLTYTRACGLTHGTILLRHRDASSQDYFTCFISELQNKKDISQPCLSIAFPQYFSCVVCAAGYLSFRAPAHPSPLSCFVDSGCCRTARGRLQHATVLKHNGRHST